MAERIIVVMRENGGWWMFAVVWGLAAVGIATEAFWAYRPRWLSAAVYLFMGWLAVFMIGPITAGLGSTGLWLLVFIIVHVKMFKFGDVQRVGADREADLFTLVTGTFHDPLWVLLYEVCLVVLGFHLWHGFASAFESLGIHRSRSNAGIVRLGKLLAILIAGGFFFIPIWAYFFGGRS